MYMYSKNIIITNGKESYEFLSIIMHAYLSEVPKWLRILIHLRGIPGFFIIGAGLSFVWS